MFTELCCFDFTDSDVTEIAKDEATKKLFSGARALEIIGVRFAEKGDFESAISEFSKAIDLCPLRASGYNNRAQAHRLLGNVEGKKAGMRSLSWTPSCCFHSLRLQKITNIPRIMR